MIKIPDEDPSIFLVHGDFGCSERFAIGPAEDREGDFAAQMSVSGCPVDVEIFCEAALRSVRQDIHPPRIVGADSHMVRNDVDDYPKFITPQFADQPAATLPPLRVRD